MKKIVVKPHAYDCDWAQCNGPCTCGADEALLESIRALDLPEPTWSEPGDLSRMSVEAMEARGSES